MVGPANGRRKSGLAWIRNFRQGVTLSRDTGQVTHKIAPNIDEERDQLVGDLNQARMVTGIYQMRGIGPR